MSTILPLQDGDDFVGGNRAFVRNSAVSPG